MDTTILLDQPLDPPATTLDERLGRLARANGVVGAAGIVTISLMFAIEVPRGGPFVFGTLNDLSGSAFNALLLPLIVRIGRELEGRPMRALTRAALAAGVAGTILPLLLVAGVLPFAVQVPFVVAAIEVQSVWLALAGRQLGRRGRVPARLARTMQVVGAAFVGGTLLAAASLPFPSGSPVQLAVLVPAGVLGVLGWCGWPVWSWSLGRALRAGRVGA